MSSRLLDAQGLVKNFGGLTAVADVSLHFDQDELIGLIGPNGAGKTTLFNLLTVKRRLVRVALVSTQIRAWCR